MVEEYRVIGVQRKSGEYNGSRYDNTVFSVVRPAVAEHQESGEICSLLKVKTSNLSVSVVVGDVVSPIYDRFGHISDLTLL